MDTPQLLTLILAAGQGTRMKSSQPKVLHQVAQRSMLGHVMALARQCGATQNAVVIGPNMEDVQKEVETQDASAALYTQDQQLGTGHAVLCAKAAYENFDGDTLILYGDTPLIRSESISQMRNSLKSGADIVVLGFEAEDPAGYGRLLTDDSGALLAIREHKDASPDELEISFCNSGVFAFRAGLLKELLPKVENNNANGEYYLTDVVEIARQQGLSIRAVSCPEEDVLGVNSRDQLARAEHIMQNRLRLNAMQNGVTLLDPSSVYFSYDTELGQDVRVEPHVFFGPGVTIGVGAQIYAFSYMEQTEIGPGALIGPFARMRPEAKIGAGAKIGNFVEVKKTHVDDGAKVNHLTYVGDAYIGKGANIGAGTITCNYDGFDKHKTEIGAGAFVGSNSALIAPVKIGEGAYVGSGSIITKDVSQNSLALSRAEQYEKPEWAAKVRSIRARNTKKK